MIRSNARFANVRRRLAPLHLQRALGRRGLLIQSPVRRTSIGTRKTLTRHDETVLFVAPIFDYFPVIVPALLEQTHPHWRLLLIHDGPSNGTAWKAVADFDDDRICYVETTSRFNDWGHSLRAIGLDLSVDLPADFIVVTNADNYYTPGFCSLMLDAVRHDRAIGGFCDLVHSHLGWSYLQARLRRKHIDCGALMVRAEAARLVGWSGRHFGADWTYVAELVERFGRRRLKKVRRVLFVHN